MTTLNDLPGHLIRRLHQISVSAFTAEVEKAGIDLTPLQFAALHALRQNPGIDQATLAGLVAHDKVTTGAVVARLAARGYVSREVSAKDRRARCLRVGEQGSQALAAAGEAVLRAQDDILGALTPDERNVFMALLRKVTDTARAPSTDGHPN